MESDLADKDAMRELQSKKGQQYSEADYKRLESLMYDKVILKLEAAQVIPFVRSRVHVLIDHSLSWALTCKRVATL